MRKSPSVLCAAAVACASFAGLASAQFQSDFESYSLGTVVGQNGWYQPVDGSNDLFVVNYNDGANFNVSGNPDGGAQVLAGTSLNAPATFARSQGFSDFSGGPIYTMCIDFWADCPPPAITTSNVGSFSMQPFGATPYTCQGLNTLFYYNDDAAGDGVYSIAWNLHNSDGSDLGGFWGPDDLGGTWPGGPWSNLQLRSWYRASYVLDFSTGQVMKLGIKNLASGEGHVFNCAGAAAGFSDDGNWYMAGGANNATALPRPTEFRTFVGGQGNGNVMAFDNIRFAVGDSLCVTDSPPGCPADFNGDGFLDFFDYDDYVNCFETGSCPPGKTADFNGDGFADFFDYDDFVGAFQAGC